MNSEVYKPSGSKSIESLSLEETSAGTNAPKERICAEITFTNSIGAKKTIRQHSGAMSGKVKSASDGEKRSK